MADPSLAVQGAIYTALGGSSGFTINGSPGTTVKVYDKVPAGAAYPYVTLDSQFVNDADFLASRMDERFLYLNVWSAPNSNQNTSNVGQKEVLEIMAEIDARLHNKRLSLATGTMVICRVKRKRTSREPDNETFMGQVTLRILTQH